MRCIFAYSIILFDQSTMLLFILYTTNESKTIPLVYTMLLTHSLHFFASFRYASDFNILEKQKHDHVACGPIRYTF